jgi:hypothetical protein
MNQVNEELLAALKAVMALVGEGKLVRDVDGDARPDWHLAAAELVRVLGDAERAILKAETVEKCDG